MLLVAGAAFGLAYGDVYPAHGTQALAEAPALPRMPLKDTLRVYTGIAHPASIRFNSHYAKSSPMTVCVADGNSKSWRVSIRYVKSKERDPLYDSSGKGGDHTLVSVTSPDGEVLAKTLVPGHLASAGSSVHWHIRRDGDSWHISLSEQARTVDLEFAMPMAGVERMDFEPSCRGLVDISGMEIRSRRECMPIQDKREIGDGADSGIPTGLWRMADRSFDEDKATLGGDYILDCQRTHTGYVLRYVSGAVVNPSLWGAGDMKARLDFTGLPGVYDVTWLDSNKQPLYKEIRCMYDADAIILQITFPYRNSTLRLAKIAY